MGFVIARPKRVCMKIIKPMLACNCNVANLDFSNKFLATPKIDGIRALKVDGKLVSRTFKQIRNDYIRKILEKLLPDNSDGEIVCGNFQETTHVVMRKEGKPDFKFMWFDYLEDIKDSYEKRVFRMSLKYTEIEDEKHIKILIPIKINSKEELLKYEEICLNQGYEGVILRTANSPYKFGRSTEKEQYLLKVKRFSDSEAIILDFGEKMKNNNIAIKDNFGRTQRSSHKENKEPLGTLGFLVVKDVKTGVSFEVGTGFNDILRQKIWDEREKWLGKQIKYKYFKVGMKDKPRHPVYLGVRNDGY